MHANRLSVQQFNLDRYVEDRSARHKYTISRAPKPLSAPIWPLIYFYEMQVSVGARDPWMDLTQSLSKHAYCYDPWSLLMYVWNWKWRYRQGRRVVRKVGLRMTWIRGWWRYPMEYTCAWLCTWCNLRVAYISARVEELYVLYII